MHRRLPRTLLVPATFVVLSACSGDSGGGPVAPGSAAIVSVSTQPGPGPLVRIVEIELSTEGTVRLEYETGDGPRLRIERTGAASYRIAATRLLPDATVYDVRVLDGEPGGDTESGTFSTEPLPPELANIDFAVTGTTSVPLVLLELRADPFFGMVVVDGSGRVVWFHELLGPPQGMTRRDNGNFVFLDVVQGLLEVTPAGEHVARLDQRPEDSDFHHDVQATPQGTVLALANETRTTAIGEVTGEQLVEWNPKTGAATRVWSVFDHFDPAVDRTERFEMDDWIHANSIRFGPRGNLVISSHFLNQVFSLAPDLDSIEWRLGGPGSTFELGPGAFFSGQHTAEEIATDRVLMFDNRFEAEGADQVSRVLELEFDREAGTASVAFEFEPMNGNWSFIISSTYRLDNGNVLAGFGAPSASAREVYEVTPGGAVAWRLVVEGAQSFFRANPLESVGEETVLSP